jgi:hypothetical protein
MTNTEIEKRLEILEAEVALLKSKAEKKEENIKPWYEKIAGKFADDPIYDEAMRLGREYRLAQKENYDEESE